MNCENITLKSRDGYGLSLSVFDVQEPGAVVKVIHGMEEHRGRYAAFAEYLQERGFAVVTADMRGHGKDAPLLSHIADQEGDARLIEDEKEIMGWIHGRYPGVPMMLFAHSMGTIIARKLLQTESRAFEKVALSGYPNPQSAAKMGITLTRTLARVKGSRGHSRLVDGMVLGGFSKATPPEEGPLGWLSCNPENREKYAADPLCGSPFTLGSYEALFRLIADIDRPELYRDVKAELPFLLISGAEDPCTGGEQGRADSLDRLTRAGFRNITVEVLPGMRHEILNETEAEKVREIIADFLAQ